MPPTLQQATTNPQLRWRLLTLRQVWFSLLWGNCSFLLGPGAQSSVCALQESISQSCVSSGSSLVGLMVTSFRRLMPYPGLLHPEPLSLRQSTADPNLHRRCSNSVSLAKRMHWSWQTPSSNKTREDSTHGHHQVVNTEIRLIIFFAAKYGEALYSQQKQDRELTVAQIMNSLLPNSDLN